MPRQLSEMKAKSAQRALEVLEYFGPGRTRATVCEIARACRFPQSSTSELLSRLTGLGYLLHDPRSRSYRPSARLALLGAWMETPLARDSAAMGLLRELARAPFAGAGLGARAGVEANVLACAGAGEKGPFGLLTTSPMGRVLLAAEAPEAALALARRINAYAGEAARAPLDALAAELDAIRQRGWTAGPGGPDRGDWMVAARAPLGAGHEPIAVFATAPRGVIEPRAEQLGLTMLRASGDHLGAVRALRAVAAA